MEDKKRITAKGIKIAFLNIYNGVIDRGAETFVKEVASRMGVRHEVVVFQSGNPNEAPLADASGIFSAKNSSHSSSGLRPRFSAKADKKEKYRVVTIPVGWNWQKKSAVGTLAARFFIDYWSRQIAYFTLRCLPRILKERFDVVVPVNGGWQPALVRIVTWLYGGKMVISGQSGMGWDDRNNLWCFPSVFICLSEKARDWAEKVNPFVRVEKIPNGVDLKKFTFKGPTFKAALKKPIVLCVGALVAAKRIDQAIKAVAKMKKASLLVVGDGDLRNKIGQLGKSLMGSRFRLMKAKFEAMPKIYRAAGLLTVPSASYHSFEIVLTEGMATNLPVVANDDAIRREIVGNAGLFVDPTDTAAYAKILEGALSTDWGDKPRRQAEKFSWDKIAKKYESLFRELVLSE